MEDVSKKNVNVNKKIYKCDYCDQEFAYKSGKSRHQKYRCKNSVQDNTKTPSKGIEFLSILKEQNEKIDNLTKIVKNKKEINVEDTEEVIGSVDEIDDFAEAALEAEVMAEVTEQQGNGEGFAVKRKSDKEKQEDELLDIF